MNQRTRGAQPIARCGKCGSEDCAFETGTVELLKPECDRIALTFAGTSKMADWTPNSMSVLMNTALKAKRVEWFYTITCSNCKWMWQQLVRETDTTEAVSLTKVFAITGLIVAALILVTLASLNISIVGWR